MSRASLVELTNLCVICDGSRILVQDKVGSGVVFPGGHVEPGESMLDSVIREMREETGLLIEHPALCALPRRPLFRYTPIFRRRARVLG